MSNVNNENLKFGFKKWYFFIAVPLVGLLMYFTVPVVDKFIIVRAYGYTEFNKGLHFANSKLGILSNGEVIQFPWDVLRNLSFFVCIIAYIFLILWIVKLIDNRVFRKRPRQPDEPA